MQRLRRHKFLWKPDRGCHKRWQGKALFCRLADGSFDVSCTFGGALGEARFLSLGGGSIVTYSTLAISINHQVSVRRSMQGLSSIFIEQKSSNFRVLTMTKEDSIVPRRAELSM